MRSRHVPPPAGERAADRAHQGTATGAAGDEPLRLTPFKRALAAAVRAGLSAVARIRVSGLELFPRDGPLIVAANHASNVDGVLLAAWLQPVAGRPIRFLAKEQLFATPLRPLLESFGTILVRAGGSDIDAYRKARAALDRGEIVGVFPEGSRSPDGVLREAYQGVAMLAARTGAPVVPVGMEGTDRFLPRGAGLPRLGTRLSVRVGRPYVVKLDPSLERRAALIAATDDLMARIGALLPEGRAGRYVTR
jgi:1-acyl-sn-glycerol-3-phosphate acyltransferase